MICGVLDFPLALIFSTAEITIERSLLGVPTKRWWQTRRTLSATSDGGATPLSS